MKVTWLKLRAIVVTGAAAVILLATVYAWMAQSGAGKTCFVKIDETNSYVEVQLNRQEDIEPVFRGQILYSVSTNSKLDSVSVETTGAQGYGNMEDTLGAHLQDPASNYWFVGPSKDFAVNPVRGSHRMFPFDSAPFAFTVTTKPALKVGYARIVNRVPGFVVDCQNVRATRTSEGAIRMEFTLERNPLVQLVSIVLLAGSACFAALILRSKTTEGLSAAAASSFFSMWSIREILSSQIHTFPTLLDLGILTMSIAVLGAVLWRTVARLQS